METCPKCGSIFIEWRGDRDCYHCLERNCQHEWKKWPKGPKTYSKVKNNYLKISLIPNGTLPHTNCSE